MSADRFRALDDLFADALARQPAERGAWLAAAADGDGELRLEVERLLAAHARMGDFLARPAAEGLGGSGGELPLGRVLGPFTLTRRIGGGGSSTVYEADQEHPRRTVAVKVLRALLPSEAAIRRFQQEADILARLAHPGIEHVYEAGVADVEGQPVPWLAMERIEGARPITEHADAAGLDVRARLRVLLEVCAAVHHGHQRGVVHCDLKPGNVLVDAGGRAKVIDFGIARAVAADEGGREWLGSPGWMSPEQRGGPNHVLDARSDVWALGALLHALLLGGPPGLQAALATSDRRRVGADLAAILARALAPDPRERYASAQALADDLQRFLDHRPVEARPPHPLYLLARFARRRRAAFLGLAGVLVVTVVGAAVALTFAFKSERARAEAEERRYLADVTAAMGSLLTGDLVTARRSLEDAPQALRGWEWRHVSSRLDRSERSWSWPGMHGNVVVASADGRVVAYASRWTPGVAAADPEQGRLLWSEAAPPEGPVPWYGLALTPDGAQLAVGLTDGRVELRDARTGRLLSTHATTGAKVLGLDFDPAGRRLAAATFEGDVCLLDTEAGGDFTCLTRRHAERVVAVAFDATGRVLASGDRAGRIVLRRVPDDAVLLDLGAHEASVDGLSFAPDGRRLASCGGDRTVRVWDTTTGALVGVGVGHRGTVSACGWSPDGEVLATSSHDREVRLWDARGRGLGLLRGHDTSLLRGLQWLADGRLLAMAQDGVVRRWDVRRGLDVPALREHTDLVRALVFLAGGRRLATASRDGLVRLFDLDAAPALGRQVAVRGDLAAVLARPDGSLLVARSSGEVLRVLEGHAPQSLGRLLAGSTAMALSPDGRRLFVGSATEVRVHDAATGARESAVWDGPAVVTALALDASGARLAVGREDGVVQVFDATRRGLLGETRVADSPVSALAFDPRGDALAVATHAGDVTLVRARGWQVRARVRGHTGRVTALAYLPDGSRLASAGQDGWVRLRHAETAETVLDLRTETSGFTCLAFSPDGTVLAGGHGAYEEPSSGVLLWTIPPPR